MFHLSHLTSCISILLKHSTITYLIHQCQPNSWRIIINWLEWASCTAGLNPPFYRQSLIRACEKSHTTHQVGAWWRAMIILLEHHSFLSFMIKSTNYNWIEIKTGLKRILERAPLQKNTSKASQNAFYVCIAISQSSRWVKACLERNIVFSDQICIE